MDYNPCMVHSVFLPQNIPVNFHVKYRIWASSLYRKCDAVIQGETFIAAQVLYNRPWMYKDVYKSP